MESTLVVADTTSSATLTTGLPAPMLAPVTKGRAVDFATCTPPATNSPQPMASAGWTSLITLPLAAKRTAPATGRTKVWMVSLMLSTMGNLSTVTSMASSTVKTPSTHAFSRALHGSCSVIRSVKRAISPTISSGR